MSRRPVLALAGLALVAGGLSACGDDGPATIDTAAIDVPAEKVARVTYTAGTTSATFEGRDGVFAPGAGATPESAVLINASDTTFPILAYRTITDVDPATPDFGLVGAGPTGAAARAKECGAACSIALTGTDGVTRKLVVGARTFNSAGFYATVEGDPRVFLLISATVAQIISLATGKPFAFPPTRQEQELAATQARLAEEAAGRGAPEANYDPFLRQVLAAAQDRKAAKEGRPADALLKAATSTQDQPGQGNQQATAAPAANQSQPEGSESE